MFFFDKKCFQLQISRGCPLVRTLRNKNNLWMYRPKRILKHAIRCLKNILVSNLLYKGSIVRCFQRKQKALSMSRRSVFVCACVICFLALTYVSQWTEAHMRFMFASVMAVLELTPRAACRWVTFLYHSICFLSHAHFSLHTSKRAVINILYLVQVCTYMIFL